VAWPPDSTHSTKPGGQAQVPFTQLVATGQATPQPPQFLVSICGSTHWSLHETQSAPHEVSAHASVPPLTAAPVLLPLMPALLPLATVPPLLPLPNRMLPLLAPLPAIGNLSSSSAVRSPQPNESEATQTAA